MKISKKEHVTYSKYWYYEFKRKRNSLKNIIYKIKTLIEIFFNIKITKTENLDLYAEKKSYLISRNLKNFKNKTLEKIIIQFLDILKVNYKKRNIRDLIKEHDNFFYKSTPIKDNFGGVGYNNSLFFFIFLRNIQPDLIVESGVWKGYTSYLIDQAHNYKKKVKFDINFNKLHYKSKNSDYYENDINNLDFIKKYTKYKKKLFFFDDHYSQFDRLKLSDSLNAKFIVFDDDISYSAIHSDGWPAAPTIKMCLEYPLIKGRTKWKSFNKVANGNREKFSYSLFNRLIKKYKYVRSPNISDITGYYHQPTMSFLIRK